MVSERLTLPPLPSAVRTLTNEESARLKQKHGDRFPTPRQCPTCGGDGYFRSRGPDGQPVEYECSCRDQWMLYRYMLNSNIGLLYQRLGWGDINNIDVKAQQLACKYAEQARFHLRTGQGLIIHGQVPGTGKTLLASLLLKQLLRQRIDGFFISFIDLMSLMRGLWKMEQDGKDWFARRIQNTGVLVIDDIGREVRTKGISDWSEENLDTLLRGRVNEARPTIITTNLTMDQLKEGYRANVMSLLLGSCSEIECPGEDYRPTALRLRNEDVELGLVRPLAI